MSTRKRDPLADWLAAGTREHYADPALYDREYGRRRDDVSFYRRLAAKTRGPILELGCGSGRLMLPLLRDGHTVVGVDAAAPMLGRLRERLAKRPAAERARAMVRRADFRRLDLRRRFPLIVCPFNAFMHLYKPSDVAQLLAVVTRHLEPGGRFVFDVMNPDLRWLSRDPYRRWARTRFRDPSTGAPMIYSTNHLYDAVRQVAFIRIYYDPVEEPAGGKSAAKPRVVRLAHRQFFPVELEQLLASGGFRVASRYGDWDGGELESESEQQICVCTLTAARRETRSRGRKAAAIR